MGTHRFREGSLGDGGHLRGLWLEVAAHVAELGAGKDGVPALGIQIEQRRLYPLLPQSVCGSICLGGGEGQRLWVSVDDEGALDGTRSQLVILGSNISQYRNMSIRCGC